MKRPILLLILGAVFLPTRAIAQSFLGGFIDLEGLFQTQDLQLFAGNLINLLFLIALGVAIVYAFIAAYNYFFAAGNMEKVMQSRNLILGVIIGLVISIAAYAIFRFVLNLTF